MNIICTDALGEAEKGSSDKICPEMSGCVVSLKLVNGCLHLHGVQMFTRAAGIPAEAPSPLHWDFHSEEVLHL